MKEANIHINFICFNGNFDHPRITVVTFVPRKQSKKPRFFPQNIVLMKKSSICICCWVCPQFLVKIAGLFKKNCYFCCTFTYRSIFEKKPNFQNDQKGRENKTNMDIFLLLLDKPLDKHGITLMHTTYPPLILLTATINQ